jgi:hypothetical protein
MSAWEWEILTAVDVVCRWRELIRRMSFENPLWGATKIHGEVLKLGIEVAQSGPA